MKINYFLAVNKPVVAKDSDESEEDSDEDEEITPKTLNSQVGLITIVIFSICIIYLFISIDQTSAIY